jgi:hypothetical protein
METLFSETAVIFNCPKDDEGKKVKVKGKVYRQKSFARPR